MISGVILAAGASKRMGVPKQTVVLAGKPILQYSVAAFLESSLARTVLVVSPAMKWRPARSPRVRVVVNPRPDRGVSSSVRVALDSVDSRSEAVVIGLGDKPLLRASTIDKLAKAFEWSDSDIIVPTYDGKRGNPVLFRARLFSELRNLKGDVGAKVLIEGGGYTVEEVPVEDIGVLTDVDVPADVPKAEKLLATRQPSPGRKPRK